MRRPLSDAIQASRDQLSQKGVSSPLGSTMGRSSQVDMGERKGAGDERLVPRVELSLDPERPDPVHVVLDRPGVQQSAGVEHHACAQQFEGFLHLERLGKAFQTGENLHRIDEAAGQCGPAHQLFPGKPPPPHGDPLSPPSGQIPVVKTSRYQSITADGGRKGW
jgi:hypothetical protein